MLRRTFTALAHTALLPVRGAARLVQQGQAQQHFYLPVLNGALGDQLAARHDERAIAFSFRQAGRDVPVAALNLHEQRPKTVVFVHGLMGDELIWQDAEAPAAPGPASTPARYGPRLAAEAGAHVLYVRYNSGLHISENGRALHQLLAELQATYPTTLGELVLVGHSMGGLVIRSAGYYGAQAAPAAAWVAALRTVFLLGVPHEGSYLEQNSAAVEQLLRRIDLLPTRLLGQALAHRSNGIKDLGQARLLDEDWQQPTQPRRPVPLLPGVAYHVLAGTLLRAGWAQTLRDYLGDGLVGTASGLGGSLAGEVTNLPPGTSLRTARFEAQHHGSLLHHEAVYAYLRQWL